MKLLYYSTAYYASHGGSTHSKHFFEEAIRHPLVKEVLLFPPRPSGGTTNKPAQLRGFLRKSGIAQVVLFIRRNRLNYNSIVRFIEEHRPDAIIMRLDSNFLQTRKLVRRFPNIVVATEVNASPFDEAFRNIAFIGLFRWLERSVLKLAVNFFVSDYLRRRIMGNSFDPGNNVVVHNGVDFNRFHPLRDGDILPPELSKSNDTFVIGYIGTLDVHKKVDVLIEAVSEIFRKTHPVQLIIVGDGPDKSRLLRIVHDLGIATKVTFTGWVAHEVIPGYIKSFDLAVHHRAENYMSPLKLFEYLACGVCVVGPRTPAVQEVFRDSQEMLMTDGTVADLREKIEMLMNDRELLTALAIRGRKFVEERYSWAHNADVIIRKLAEKVLERRKTH